MTGLHNVHGISRVKHSPQHLPDTITPRDLLTSSHVYHCGFFDTFSFWRTLPKPPTTLRSERISGGYFGHHDFGRWHPRFFRCWLYRRSACLSVACAQWQFADHPGTRGTHAFLGVGTNPPQWFYYWNWNSRILTVIGFIVVTILNNLKTRA
jgi:hypothetical protein